MKKKRKYFIIGIFLIAVILLTCVSTSFKNRSDGTSLDEVLSKSITIEEVESLYDKLMNQCEGAIIWNLSVGESVMNSDESVTGICQNDGYYSKLFGFTDSIDGAIMDVKVMRIVDEKAVDMDNRVIGDFSSEMVSTLLDLGTTYRYYYTIDNGSYFLKQVESLDVIQENS